MHRKINENRQITLTPDELDSIHTKPGDAIEVWTDDGMDCLVISKAEPDVQQKDAVASRQ